MRPDEIARSFDDRPGFNLVDFEEVGLPVYRLTSTVLTLQPKAYSAIEEFVLRAVEAGLATVETVAGFLGISMTIVEATASILIKDDELTVSPTGTLRLTRKSERVLAGESHIRPHEQSLVFRYDGLTRRPIRTDELRLWEPRDLRDRGIREIRPFPPKRPNPEEIKGDELQAVLRTPSQATEPSVQILQVKSISRAFANFIPAIALIFRRLSGNEVQVGFAIDGRLSREHEDAFAASDGPARMGIAPAILNAKPLPDDSGFNLPIAPPKPDVAGAQAQREKAISKLRRQIAAKREEQDPTAPALGDSSPPNEVEMIAVYDHPPLLRMALEEAVKRLIIISPWITDAVVDKSFLQKLTQRLNDGVDVYIGYGLGEEERVPTAVKHLEKLASDHHNFRFVRLGNTHAKILIKDDDWLVTTSFNWLSFRGDPKRTFREEWGTRIAMRDQVAAYALTILKRFDVGGSGPP
ncbi:phospholipase D-like domain-containing protein [Mesorhizobium kowhaii]|nr:phospholipase D-like domain-containing protein [Mesorhizobium kowhaii]